MWKPSESPQAPALLRVRRQSRARPSPLKIHWSEARFPVFTSKANQSGVISPKKLRTASIVCEWWRGEHQTPGTVTAALIL